MLIDQLQEDLNKALKEKDNVAVSALRLMLSNLHNAKIAKGGELTDEDAVAELSKDAKRHKESITAFEQAGRSVLADKEKAELAVILRYLPEQISEEEIKKQVDEAISQIKPAGLLDMGKVMSAVMAKLKGQADGALVSSIVKSKLGS